MKKTILILLFFSQMFGLDGTQIAEMLNSRFIPDDLTSHAKMILTNAKGKVRSRKMISMSTDRGKKQIIWFIEPKSERGISFLKIEHDSKTDEMRMWLPAFKKTRRISPKNRGDKFMGSELSYEDLSNRDPNEHVYFLLDSVRFNGTDCYLLETKPSKSNYSSYSKHVSWISKKNLTLIKEHSYDKKGQLRKEKEFLYQKIEHYNIIKRIFVKNKQTQNTTEILFSDTRVNSGLNKSFFHEKNLKKIPKY